ncbi:MAG: hypothetical protein ABIF71_05165 [Planctomycetota bacterium]
MTAAIRTGFTAVEPGVWWFHVRAQDAQGAWGATGHLKIEIAGE